MRNSRPDGTSIFGSPVYIVDTQENWQIAIKTIKTKWRFVSITAEPLPNTSPLQISLINIYCFSGPLYIFDLSSINYESAKPLIKSITENKELFKLVFDISKIGDWFWQSLQCKFVYTIDVLVAYNVSNSLPLTHHIHISNFCSWIGKVNVPFLAEVVEESQNEDYWKRRPIIYIMQCYLSGVVSVIMKAWLDIRADLSDEQVHSIFNFTKETMSKVYGDSASEDVMMSKPAFVFTSRLSKFSFDKVSIVHAFDSKIINS